MCQNIEFEEEDIRIGETYKPKNLRWRDKIIVNCATENPMEAIFLGYLKGSDKNKVVAIPRNACHAHVYEDWSTSENSL